MGGALEKTTGKITSELTRNAMRGIRPLVKMGSEIAAPITGMIGQNVGGLMGGMTGGGSAQQAAPTPEKYAAAPTQVGDITAEAREEEARKRRQALKGGITSTVKNSLNSGTISNASASGKTTLGG